MHQEARQNVTEQADTHTIQSFEKRKLYFKHGHLYGQVYSNVSQGNRQDFFGQTVFVFCSCFQPQHCSKVKMRERSWGIS